MLEKTYDPKSSEPSLCQRWARPDFYAHHDAASKGEPFCIMMPPANVTGSLHMGHALTYTLQDTLIRFHRMMGRKVLWQPGIDHAGIATQMVVERQLDEKGIKRQNLEREAFLEHVWSWKETSGGLILDQLKRLGCSADWSRTRFTMDEPYCKAVILAFVDLHRKGLIYRDKRLVNWDVKFQTAISDLEVESREEKGHMWHIAYPLVDDKGQATGEHITIATTRPETLLGDTAVAVHPDDPRYTPMVGRHVRVPLTDRTIPIIPDHHCEPEKGTGAVKITPAHDFNDFQVGKRHALPAINILTATGHLNDAVPKDYQGLERHVAREKIVADLTNQGFLVDVETIVHTIPYGDRSGVVIEPWLTDQWFIDAAQLAPRALEAVASSITTFVPDQWRSVYNQWLMNIEPWCISRQIWWGHQIPAWYGPDGEIFVAANREEALRQAQNHYGTPTVDLVQDPDVLDTWFSSALWPFATLGWPETDPMPQELVTFYPTQVLVTGFDIIFFWVARMMMMGLHFMDDVPFKDVYINPLVLDAKGQKMSKSKGNVINPLTTIETFGADALRFTLTSLTVQGRDIKLSEKRVEGSRNFMTKLWNVARYLEMNRCTLDASYDPYGNDITLTPRVALNQWILSKLDTLIHGVTEALGGYRLNEASQLMYHFIWGTFCDWYVEFTKPLLAEGTPEDQAETRACLSWCFVQLLKLLHPIAPFITDTLALSFIRPTNGDAFSLSKTPWPSFPQARLLFPEASEEIDWVQGLITAIRGLRSECNLPAGAKLSSWVVGLDDRHGTWLSTHTLLINRLARLSSCQPTAALPSGCLQLVYGAVTIGIPVEGIIDLSQENKRLQNDIARLEEDRLKIKGKLDNTDFTTRAPQEVVDDHRQRLEENHLQLDKTRQALERLQLIS